MDYIHPPNPKVSIVMSVYNGSNYVSIALDSVLCQSIQQFEFIVIDDGSTDRTWEILSDYGNKDHRIILIRNPNNIGLTRSLNKGIAAARGIYIARQDADDISLPQRLEIQSKYLDTHPGVVLVSANFDRIDSNGRLIRRIKRDCKDELLEWHLLFYNHIEGHSQVMFRRETAATLGGYPESYFYAQDYELWTRFLNHGKIKIIEDVLLKYRVHNDTVSKKNSTDQLTFTLKTSQNQIYKIIGERLPIKEIAQLWSFWSVTPLKKDMFKNNEIKFCSNDRLKQIFRNYVRNKKIMDKRIKSQLAFSIGERYVKWCLFVLLKQHRWTFALQLAGHAVDWLGHRVIYACAKICLIKVKILLESKFNY